MKPAEAVRLIAMLGAYYGREIGEDTAGLWAKSLVAFEVEDGMEAVHLLGVAGRFMPSLADVTDAIRECRNDRLKREAVSLPAAKAQGIRFAEYLRDNPDMAERVRALDEKKPGAQTNPIREAIGGLLRRGL